jgi:hypothetical protein
LKTNHVVVMPYTAVKMHAKNSESSKIRPGHAVANLSSIASFNTDGGAFVADGAGCVTLPGTLVATRKPSHHASTTALVVQLLHSFKHRCFQDALTPFLVRAWRYPRKACFMAMDSLAYDESQLDPPNIASILLMSCSRAHTAAPHTQQ